MFPAAELFGQNARFSRTEPCRSPTPTSPAPAWSAMPPSSGPTAARSPCGGVPTTGWVSRTRSPSCVCSADSPNRRPWRSTGRSQGSRPCSWAPTPRRSTPTPAGGRRSWSISSASASTCVCALFDAAAGERLARFLEDEALRLERTASLLARARAWLRDEHVLAPSDSVLRRAIGAARHKARTLLTQRMAERLSAPMREGLDALVAVDDDQPHSPLNRIKASSSNPSVRGMKRLLARLELIEATGVLGVDVDSVNGNYQRILFHSVRTASADRVRRMAAPRRHLALVCFLHQAWRDTLDQAVDMYGKLLDRNRKLVEARLDDMLKAQRQAVDRIVHQLPPARRGAARSRRRRRRAARPAAVNRARGAAARGPVRPGELDAGRPEGPLRADGRAARRAEPVRRAVSEQDEVRREQGEGASPTLSALRAFAPAALQPLIRHDGVTDRRRWESALFLKVRDEIQTGDLAIDGAKNFGRFEAFFLPAARWEQVREAFWARTGFPVDPAAAVEQLRARLSDAFDRFLKGVADNRQVAFDDDGWRLKTDAAEQPDPAQSEPPRRASPLAGRPQPLDPARRPAHRGRERPRVQRPLPAAWREAGRPRGCLRPARRGPRPFAMGGRSLRLLPACG